MPRTRQHFLGTTGTAANWNAVGTTDSSLAGTATANGLIVTNAPWGFLNVTQPPISADPSGSVDATTALQSALNLGTNLFFPDGTYKVSATLYSTNHIGFRGSSQSKAILRSTATFTGSDLLQIRSATNGFQLSDIGMDLSTTTKRLIAVHTLNCQQGHTFDRVWIKGDGVTYGGCGIQMDSDGGSWGGLMTAQDSTFTYLDTGIEFTNSTGGSVISHNQIINGVGTTSRGVVFNGSGTGGTRITENEIEGWATGIYEAGVGGIIMPNRFETCKTNIVAVADNGIILTTSLAGTAPDSISTNYTYLGKSGIQAAGLRWNGAGNLMLQSEDMSVSPWSAGAGITAVQNNVTDPLGTLTAATLTPSLATGAIIQYPVTGDVNGRSFTFSIWMRSSAGTKTVNLFLVKQGESSEFGGSIVLTTAWTLYTYSGTVANPTTNFGIYIASTANTDAFYAWRPSLRYSEWSADYVPTTASAVTASLSVFHGNTFLNGNVGVGTNAPSEALEVAGNIKASGYKSWDGANTFTGITATNSWVDASAVTWTMVIQNGLVTSMTHAP